jgi:C-terminal processing protease CtpA/Prc
MEFDAGVPGQKFYRPYLQPEAVENRVLDVDLKIVSDSLRLKYENANPEKVVNRIRDHYLDSTRLIKRSFGEIHEEDFQHYNWGLVLTNDISLDTDKLELLILTYSKDMPRRVTLMDFQEIIIKHTSFRHITEKKDKKEKWMDLVMSFKLNTISKRGYPGGYYVAEYVACYLISYAADSIGKREFQLIININELSFDIDFLKLTTDFRKIDKYSNRLHMLLVHDPLIQGNFGMNDLSLPFKNVAQLQQISNQQAHRRNNRHHRSSNYGNPSRRKDPVNTVGPETESLATSQADISRAEKFKDFERFLELEEVEFSNFERRKERLQGAFDVETKLAEERGKRHAARSAEKAALAEAERTEKDAALVRLKQIIAEREAYELQKKQYYYNKAASQKLGDGGRLEETEDLHIDTETAAADAPADVAAADVVGYADETTEETIDRASDPIREILVPGHACAHDPEDGEPFDPMNPNLEAFREVRRREKQQQKEEMNRLIQAKLQRHKDKLTRELAKNTLGVSRSMSTKEQPTVDGGVIYVPKTDRLYPTGPSSSVSPDPLLDRPASASKQRIAVKDVIASARNEIALESAPTGRRPHTSGSVSSRVPASNANATVGLDKSEPPAKKPKNSSTLLKDKTPDGFDTDGLHELNPAPEEDIMGFLFGGIPLDMDRIERLRSRGHQEEIVRQAKLKEIEQQRAAHEALRDRLREEEEWKRKTKLEETEKVKKLRAERQAESAAMKALEEEIRLEYLAQLAVEAEKSEHVRQQNTQRAQERQAQEERVRMEKERIRKVANATKRQQDEERKKIMMQQTIEAREAKAKANLEWLRQQQLLAAAEKNKKKVTPASLHRQELAEQDQHQPTEQTSLPPHGGRAESSASCVDTSFLSAESPAQTAFDARLQLPLGEKTSDVSDYETTICGPAESAYEDLTGTSELRYIDYVIGPDNVDVRDQVAEPAKSAMDMLARARAIQYERVNAVQSVLQEHLMHGDDALRSECGDTALVLSEFDASEDPARTRHTPPTNGQDNGGEMYTTNNVRILVPEPVVISADDVRTENIVGSQRKEPSRQTSAPKTGKSIHSKQLSPARTRTQTVLQGSHNTPLKAQARTPSPASNQHSSTNVHSTGVVESHIHSVRHATTSNPSRHTQNRSHSSTLENKHSQLTAGPVLEEALEDMRDTYGNMEAAALFNQDDAAVMIPTQHSEAGMETGDEALRQPADEGMVTIFAGRERDECIQIDAFAPVLTQGPDLTPTKTPTTPPMTPTTRPSSKIEHLKPFEILHNVLIEGDEVSVGVEALTNDPFTARSTSSVDTYSTHTSFTYQTQQSLSLLEYLSVPYQELDFHVTKTNGELKLIIRHDDEGDSHGLFIHGFKSNSNAELEGNLQIGDELIEINKIVVKGKYLQDIVDAIGLKRPGPEPESVPGKHGDNDVVQVKVHRRSTTLNSAVSGHSTLFSGRSQAGGSAGWLASHHGRASSWNDDESLSIGESLQSLPSIMELGHQNTDVDVIFDSDNLATSGVSAGKELPNIVEGAQAENGADILQLLVPLTDGELRVILRREDGLQVRFDAALKRGPIASRILVHGFKTSSLAEQQGLLRIHDEVIAINGVSVMGQHMDGIIHVLKQLPEAASEVLITVKRTKPIFETAPSGAETSEHDDSAQHAIMLISPLESPRMRYSPELKSAGPVYHPQEVNNDNDAARACIENEPGDDALTEAPAGFEDYSVDVPKTDGELRLILRQHDDSSGGGDPYNATSYYLGHGHVGVFVHGFKSFAKAEHQGILRIGDEIIGVEGISTLNQLQPMHAIGKILQQYKSWESIRLQVRRKVPEHGSVIRNDGGTEAERSSSAAVTSSMTSVVSPRPSALMAQRADVDCVAPVGCSVEEPEGFRGSPPSESPLGDVFATGEVYDIMVPKTQFGNGRPSELGVLIKHDVISASDMVHEALEPSAPVQVTAGAASAPAFNSDRVGVVSGLFIHGVKPNTRAREQGLLRVGDELLAVDDVNVQGKYLERVVKIIMRNTDDYVKLTVRRTAGAHGISDQFSALSDGADASKSSIPTAAEVNQRLQLRSQERQTTVAQLVSKVEDISIDAYTGEYEIITEKVNNSLRIVLRQDDHRATVANPSETLGTGLFVHGFLTNCPSERQAIIRIGDELLSVNGVPIDSEEDIGRALVVSRESPHNGSVTSSGKRFDSRLVKLKLRRKVATIAPGLVNVSAATVAKSADAADKLTAGTRTAGSKEMLAILSPRALGSSRPSGTTNLPPLPASLPLSVKSSLQSHSSVPSRVDNRRSSTDSASSQDGRSVHSRRSSALNTARLFTADEVLDITVPKTQGELRVLLRHDILTTIDDATGNVSSTKHGVFIHGIKPNSLAKQQGLLRAGDEVIAVNGILVEGAYLEDVITILQSPVNAQNDFVVLSVRRVEDGHGIKDDYELEQTYSGVPSADNNLKLNVSSNGGIQEKYHTDILSHRSVVNTAREDDTSTINTLRSGQLYDVTVPKTDGELAVLLRHDDNIFGGEDRGGLFIHGVKPNSKAKEQGLLRPGDELVAVNGMLVEGAYLEDVIAVLDGNDSKQADNVVLTIRRVTGGHGITDDYELETGFMDVARAAEVVQFVRAVSEDTPSTPFGVDKGGALSTIHRPDAALAVIDDFDDATISTRGEASIENDDVSIGAFDSEAGVLLSPFKVPLVNVCTSQTTDSPVLAANNISFQGATPSKIEPTIEKVESSLRQDEEISLYAKAPIIGRKDAVFSSEVRQVDMVVSELDETGRASIHILEVIRTKGEMRVFIKANERKRRRRQVFKEGADDSDNEMDETDIVEKFDIHNHSHHLSASGGDFRNKGVDVGFVVAGFPLGSKAAKQGAVQLGDEIIAIDNVQVPETCKSVQQLSHLLKESSLAGPDFVHITVRRKI